MRWWGKRGVSRYTGLLGLLILVAVLGSSPDSVLSVHAAQANAATPASAREAVDKYKLYSQRLQELLDRQPFAERWWRERRAFPYFDRAARLAQQHDHNGALEEYAKYLASDPEHLMMRWQQLLTLTETEKLQETVAAATALLQHVPDFGPALLIRGLTLRKLGMTDQAEQDLLAAQADRTLVAADRTLLLSERYTMALNRQDFATALSVLEEQRAYQPGAADVHESRAVLLDQLGRFTEAEEAWERVVSLTTDQQKRQQATLARARMLEKLQRFEAALTLLASAPHNGVFTPANTPTEHLKALYELSAEIAMKAGKSEAAIEALERLLVLHESTPTRLALANQFLSSGKAPQALEVLQPLRKQAASLPRGDRAAWYTTLGNTAFAAQQLPVALEAYQQALALQDTPERRLQAAEVAWQLTRYGDVVALLQPLERPVNGHQPPQMVAWQRRLCTAYARHAQYDAALGCLERQLAAEPGNVEVASAAAALAAQTQQPQRQVRYLQHVYRHQPTPALALDIGHLLSHLARHDEAVDWVRRAYDDGHSATAGLAYAQLLLQQHRQAAAIVVLRDITSHPDDLSAAAQSTAYTALGYALADTDDFRGAAEAWQQAYRLSADPVVQSRRVWALRRAGEIEQARAEVDDVPVANLPAAEQVKWYEETGTLWYQLGDFQRSLEAREKTLEFEPTGQRWVQLSDTLIALERLSEADHALAEALQLHPDTPEYLTRRGYLHIALHNDRSAAEFFEQARQLDDSLRALDGELGYLYTRLAENDRAIAAFQRAIDHAALSRAVTRAEQREVQDSMARMRGQIHAMERRWSFSLVHNTCLLDNGCRVGNIAAGDGASGLAFGSVEVAYQPPKIGFRNGKILQIFARLLWAYEPEAFSLQLDEDSVQAGLGVRYKPFAAHNLWLALEHLFKIGDDTENNWLARLSWSFTRGTQWQSLLDGETAPDAATPYISLYADIAKFLQHDQELLLLGEARFGRTWQRGKRWLFSPFVYALGRATINGDLTESNAEGGVGLAVRFRFDFDKYWGHRRDIELLLRYGHDFHNSESGLQPRAIAGVRFSF